MKILVIDNYDSFTYNLVHYLENTTSDHIDVYRNDKISLEAIDAYDKILLSPGPGIPEESGICLDLIQQYAPKKSILGVCLGHQAIAEAFGGSLINLDTVYHGVSSIIDIVTPEDTLYTELPDQIEVGRYHSWVVAKKDLPDCFKITSLSQEGLIMGISHKNYDVKGVQYHPESVLTENGMKIIENWINS
ncbi:MAG TPA: aminodeoxychorismate/anthranilate synthase component II [Bacteroidales bacterium]|jgi:anthranilate synthase component 2|nr:aminodeoxychorismate/anthranilate synthase component II [Bacteroidales bacterium]